MKPCILALFLLAASTLTQAQRFIWQPSSGHTQLPIWPSAAPDPQLIVAMHLYAQGGRAFGLRRTKFPITAWPELVEKWLGTVGMIAN